MTKGLTTGAGSECNRAKVGGTTRLFGDPAIKLEKPHTIVLFPGGSVEVARTTDGAYWVHVAVKDDGLAGGRQAARIVNARVDHDGRYNDAGNAVLREAIAAGDVNHIAFLVQR